MCTQTEAKSTWSNFFKFPLLFLLLGGGGVWRRNRQRGRESQRRNEYTDISKQVLCMSYMHTCMFRYTLVWRPDKDIMLHHFYLLLETVSLAKTGAVSQQALENLLSLSSKITEIIGMQSQFLHG